MNVYVETNFVIELVFQQEQHVICEAILKFCENSKAKLIIPAYCLAEPHEKLVRRNSRRKELQNMLNVELRRLARTSSYTTRINNIQDIASLLVQSNEEELQRFEHYHGWLLKISEIIPLTADILRTAALNKALYGLTPQDAIVYTSVVSHLQQQALVKSCFLNKNSKDFDNPDIVNELNKNSCFMIPKFEQGYQFIQTHS